MPSLLLRLYHQWKGRGLQIRRERVALQRALKVVAELGLPDHWTGRVMQAQFEPRAQVELLEDFQREFPQRLESLRLLRQYL